MMDAYVCILLMCLSVGVLPQRSPLTFTLTEELPPDTLVGDIPRDSHLKAVYREVDTFRYTLLPCEYHDLFQVDAISGLLRTRTRLDRELWCEKKRHCVLSLDVAVMEPIHLFQIILVHVVIQDVNDHPPEFSETNVILLVSEAAQVGKTLSISQARDRDVGSNDVQGYELLPAASPFVLLEKDHQGGEAFVRLRLVRPLDYEMERSIDLRLVAHDGGSPCRTAVVQLDIRVSDVNDNGPRFERPLYNVTVREDQYPLTPIVRVQATDPDHGPNGLVLYSMTLDSNERYGDKFSVDNSTGDVFLTSSLTSPQETYTLAIQAWDQGHEQLTDLTKVIVQVDDVNNHAPRVSVIALTNQGLPQVAENLPPGTVVALLATEDSDKGANGAVECETSDPDFQLILLYQSKFKLVTSTRFDREERELYSVTVTCHDLGFPPQQTQHEVIVQITDTNDELPVFSQTVYTVTVTENNPALLRLTQVTASDGDTGRNADLTYHLIPGDCHQDLLDLDPETGVITAVGQFDYEKLTRVKCGVFVRDGGRPELNSTAALVIDVQDENDEAPMFRQTGYSFGTFENQAVGTTIGTLPARDNDSPPYDSFTMTIVTSSPGVNDTFDIDATTGKLTSLRKLDREAVAVYYLTISAVDSSDPGLSTSCSVTVYIADTNDNPPFIAYPNPDNQSVYIPADVTGGHFITKIQAYDLDLGRNGQLVFAITEGNGDEHFDVDPRTGAVFVIKSLDVPSQAGLLHFQLSISVTDKGTPSLSSFSSLTITADSSTNLTYKSAPELTFHQLVVIMLSAFTAVLVTILVTAILFVRRRYQGNKSKPIGVPLTMATGDDRGRAANQPRRAVNMTSSTQPNSMVAVQCVRDWDRKSSGSIADSGHGNSEDASISCRASGETYKSSRSPQITCSVKPSKEPTLKSIYMTEPVHNSAFNISSPDRSSTHSDRLSQAFNPERGCSSNDRFRTRLMPTGYECGNADDDLCDNTSSSTSGSFTLYV